MAGLWAEHFQNYAAATDLTNAGVFASVDVFWTISTANPPRSGGASLHAGQGSASSGLRRIFGAAKPGGAGVAFRMFITNLPPSDTVANPTQGNCFILGAFLDASGQCQGFFNLGSDGSVILATGPIGAGRVVVARSKPCITAGAYNHIEMKYVPGASAGTMECRVNGVSVANFTGPTQTTSLAEVSQWQFGAETLAPAIDLTDLHAWDTVAGNGPVDFVGNCAVLRRQLTADTATAAFTKSTGTTGFNLLTDKSDATFIQSNNVSDKSAFQAAALPANTTGIIYQQVSFRGIKTDASDCSVAASLVSGSSETAVTGQPLTTGEAWRWGVFANDPATSAPWTFAGANASTPAVTRTL